MMGSGGKCCAKRYSALRHNRGAQTVVFIVITALNILDLSSDWLLFHDVDAAEKGLVFGPPEKAIHTSLLVFCIIGSILFTFEILNLGKDIFTERPWMDFDVASAMIVWFEDIPQLSISCYIIACRDEAISIFQLGKASVVILGAFIRMIIGIIRACRRRKSDNYQKLAQCTWFKFIMFFGFSLMIAGSITIFMFSQTTIKRDGSLRFHKINNLFEGEYDDEKYFERVGIYGDMGFLGNRNSDSEASDIKSKPWIKLFEIHDIRHLETTITVSLRYNNELKSNFAITKIPNDKDKNMTEECFHSNSTTMIVSKDINCQKFSSIPSSDISTLLLRFKYVVPRNHLIMGDIAYNRVMAVNGSCKSVSSMSDKELAINVMAPRYFQVNSLDKAEGYLINRDDQNKDYSFYRVGESLKVITEVWKTGFLGCENSGSISPNFDSSIQISC